MKTGSLSFERMGISTFRMERDKTGENSVPDC